MLRVVFFLLATAATLPAAIAAGPLSISSFNANENGSASVTIDDPSVGVLDMILLDIASPEYSEFYLEGGQMRQIATTTPDVRCAYAGVARDNEEVATVTMVSCGANGPRLSVSFVNGTVIKMKKIGEGTSLEGAYDVRADVAGLTGGLNLSYAYFEQKGITVELAGSHSDESSVRRRRGRSLLNAHASADILYFDYVFVSDTYRYANYGNDLTAVMQDTVDEIAAVNTIYLVGDAFSPQIQFRIKSQIVWTELPSLFDPTNVPNDEPLPNALEAQYGLTTQLADGVQYLNEFERWVFETTYFRLTDFVNDGGDNVDAYFVAGANAALENADGWHILSGQFSFMSGSALAAGIASAGTSCLGDNKEEWRSACRAYFDYNGANTVWGTANADGLISDGIPGGIAQYSGDTIVARCQSNRAIGVTSLLNTPSHRFPGYVLAHEIAHNLGFLHVYNQGEGDSNGNENDCLTNNPHNGSAVLGYSNEDGSVSWHACSVAKFSEMLNGDTLLGVPSAGGRYTCATPASTGKLPETFNPVGVHFAEGQDGYLHHLNAALSSPNTPNPPPGTPTNPSPPPTPPAPGAPPVPDGHAPLVFKLLTPYMTSDKKEKIRNAFSSHPNAHAVTY